jgi:hypothetical protein
MGEDELLTSPDLAPTPRMNFHRQEFPSSAAERKYVTNVWNPNPLGHYLPLVVEKCFGMSPGQ